MRSSSLPVLTGAPDVKISLPPSASTSDAEEAHALLVERHLARTHESRAAPRRSASELAFGEHLIGPAEPEERRDHRTVLGGAPARGDVRAQHAGERHPAIVVAARSGRASS